MKDFLYYEKYNERELDIFQIIFNKKTIIFEKISYKVINRLLGI